MWRAGVALQTTVENIRDFVWEIYYWDLRTLNNTKPYFFLNEMNTKDLPAMYSTAFLCLFVVLLIFLALLRNRCYSLHRTKWRLVTSICRGPGPVAKKMPFFSPKFKSAANFSAPAQEGNLFFLSERSAQKKSIISSSNRAICAGLRGTSGFPLVPVTTVAPTN